MFASMVKVFWRAFENVQQTQQAEDIFRTKKYWQDKGLETEKGLTSESSAW